MKFNMQIVYTRLHFDCCFSFIFCFSLPPPFMIQKPNETITINVISHWLRGYLKYYFCVQSKVIVKLYRTVYTWHTCTFCYSFIIFTLQYHVVSRWHFQNNTHGTNKYSHRVQDHGKTIVKKNNLIFIWDFFLNYFYTFIFTLASPRYTRSWFYIVNMFYYKYNNINKTFLLN